jgi:thymidine kinase
MIKSKNLIDVDIKDFDVIIVDESHFFDDLIDFTTKCLESNKYIIVAGLIADSKGHKFGKTLDLVPICTNIKRLHAYCSECAKEKKCNIAIYSKKIVKCKKSIDIGGSEKHIPVCRFHFNQNEQIIGLGLGLGDENNKIKNKTNKSKKIEKEVDLSDKSNCNNIELNELE